MKSLLFVPTPKIQSKLTQANADLSTLFSQDSATIESMKSQLSKSDGNLDLYRSYITALSNALQSPYIQNKALQSQYSNPFNEKQEAASTSIITELMSVVWNFACDSMTVLKTLDSTVFESLKSMNPIVSDIVNCADTLELLSNYDQNGTSLYHAYITPNMIAAFKIYAHYIADNWQLCCIANKNEEYLPRCALRCLEDLKSLSDAILELDSHVTAFFIPVIQAARRYLQLITKMHLGKNAEAQLHIGQAIAFYKNAMEFNKSPIEDEMHAEKKKKKKKDSPISQFVVQILDACDTNEKMIEELNKKAVSDNAKIYGEAIPDLPEMPQPVPAANIVIKQPLIVFNNQAPPEQQTQDDKPAQVPQQNPLPQSPMQPIPPAQFLQYPPQMQMSPQQFQQMQQYQSSTVQTQTPPEQPQSPPIQLQTPPVQLQTPAVQPQTPSVQQQAPPAQLQVPLVQPQTPSVPQEAPPVQPLTPATQQLPPSVQQQAPLVQPQTPPMRPVTPSVQQQAPPVQPQTPPMQPLPPSVQPQAPPVQPQTPADHSESLSLDQAEPMIPQIQPTETGGMPVENQATDIYQEIPEQHPESADPNKEQIQITTDAFVTPQALDLQIPQDEPATPTTNQTEQSIAPPAQTEEVSFQTQTQPQLQSQHQPQLQPQPQVNNGQEDLVLMSWSSICIIKQMVKTQYAAELANLQNQLRIAQEHPDSFEHSNLAHIQKCFQHAIALQQYFAVADQNDSMIQVLIDQYKAKKNLSPESIAVLTAKAFHFYDSVQKQLPALV